MRNLQPGQENAAALACALRDVNSQVSPPAALSNGAFLVHEATLSSRSLQEINPFLVSVWREQQNKPAYLSSSWKASCATFGLCNAALKEQACSVRRRSRPGSCLLRVVKHEGEGAGVGGGGHRHVLLRPHHQQADSLLPSDNGRLSRPPKVRTVLRKH